MEVDNIHSTIERAMKKRVINVRSEYIDVCKNARAYDVMFLDLKFFKSFDNVQFLKSIRPGHNKGDSKITDIRAFKIIPKLKIVFLMYEKYYRRKFMIKVIL